MPLAKKAARRFTLSPFSSEEQQIRAIKKVAVEFGRDKNATTLAHELGVSPAKVLSWVTGLRKAGINVPKIFRKGMITKAVSELASERPDLIRRNNQ